MSKIIKFPPREGEITHEKIHELIDELDYPSEFTGVMIVVTCKDKTILSCFDSLKGLECIGVLEVLKEDIIKNMY